MKHEEKTFLDKALLFILGGIVVTLPLQVTKQLFPIYVFGSEFPILELSRLLIALGSVVLLVRAIRQRILIIPKNAVALAVYALVGLSIVSVLMYFSFSGLRELVRYGFHLAFFMFVVNTINDREERRFLWKCLIGSGLCVALFSIVQYFTGFYLWNTGLDDGVFRRVNATFHDPNVLASFMGWLFWRQRLITLGRKVQRGGFLRRCQRLHPWRPSFILSQEEGWWLLSYHFWL